MSTTSIAFLVALLVGIISVIFSDVQGKRLEAMLRDVTPENSLMHDKVYLSARIFHSLDVSTNYPSAVLTLIAWLVFVPPPFMPIPVGLMAILTLVSVELSKRHYSSRYFKASFRGKISVYTAVLFLANVIGLILSFRLPSE